MIKFFLSVLFLLTTTFAFAQQDSTSPQMADAFRSDGKIYVVITVIAMIFIALVIFLILLERRIKKIEKQIEKH